MHSIPVSKSNTLIFPAVLSFGITLLRCFFAVTIFIIIATRYQSSIFLVSTLIVAIMGFDQIDGVLFRRSSLNSSHFWRRSRRIIDSFADRFCIQVVCITFLVYHPTFLMFFLLITLKEASNALPCIIEYKKSRELLEPKISAKISTASIGFLVISCMFDLSMLSILLVIIMLITGVLSMLEYNRQRDYLGVKHSV